MPAKAAETMRDIPQFMIAAPASGSGKTTVSRGLMALLVKKGFTTQPFKCGPDYIDTKYHAAMCHRPSVNLDTFMASAAHVRRLYARYSSDADAVIVEGMMGLFDGYDRSRGSSAEITQLLRLPVVLVVDAKSAAYSLAPMLYGFIRFCPEIEIAGIIFNRVGSARHYEMLQDVCADLEVTCLGYLPKQKLLEQETRYLGLDFSRLKDMDVAHLADLLEQYVDWQSLLKKTTRPLPEVVQNEPETPFVSTELLSLTGDRCAEEPEGHLDVSDITEKVSEKGKPLHIVVACNEESFSFLYAEHLDILRGIGSVSLFDPEQNLPLPQDTGLLYLPGGYPEKHAATLSAARRTLESVRQYIEAGGKVLAECGGMMYLSKAISGDRKEGYPDGNRIVNRMVGAFPFCISAEASDKKLVLGYRQLRYNGLLLRGHEFHYTRFGAEGVTYNDHFKTYGGDCRLNDEDNCMMCLPTSVAQVYNAKGQPVDTPFFRYKNVIASYTHLYWGEIDPMSLF